MSKPFEFFKPEDFMQTGKDYGDGQHHTVYRDREPATIISDQANRLLNERGLRLTTTGKHVKWTETEPHPAYETAKEALLICQRPIEECEHKNKEVFIEARLMSDPPQYRWKCYDCEFVESMLCSDYKGEKVECDHFVTDFKLMEVGSEGRELSIARLKFRTSHHNPSIKFCPKCGEKLK